LRHVIRRLICFASSMAMPKEMRWMWWVEL
jgi:hypothetical protein